MHLCYIDESGVSQTPVAVLPGDFIGDEVGEKTRFISFKPKTKHPGTLEDILDEISSKRKSEPATQQQLPAEMPSREAGSCVVSICWSAFRRRQRNLDFQLNLKCRYSGGVPGGEWPEGRSTPWPGTAGSGAVWAGEGRPSWNAGGKRGFYKANVNGQPAKARKSAGSTHPTPTTTTPNST